MKIYYQKNQKQGYELKLWNHEKIICWSYGKFNNRKCLIIKIYSKISQRYTYQILGYYKWRLFNIIFGFECIKKKEIIEYIISNFNFNTENNNNDKFSEIFKIHNVIF